MNIEEEHPRTSKKVLVSRHSLPYHYIRTQHIHPGRVCVDPPVAPGREL
jgi:hypothetical protein